MWVLGTLPFTSPSDSAGSNLTPGPLFDLCMVTLRPLYLPPRRKVVSWHGFPFGTFQGAYQGDRHYPHPRECLEGKEESPPPPEDPKALRLIPWELKENRRWTKIESLTLIDAQQRW